MVLTFFGNVSYELIVALFGNVFNNIFTNRTHFDLLYNKSLSFCAFCTYTVTFLCVFYLFTIVLFFYAMNLLKEFSIFESLLLMTFFHTQWVPVRNYFLFALVCIPSGTFFGQWEILSKFLIVQKKMSRYLSTGPLMRLARNSL